MPTPLENYLNRQYPNQGIPVSQTIAIIGTDNNHPNADLLLILYQALAAQAPAVHANCLAAYLINNGLAWSPARNAAWLAATIGTPNLDTFYIAHTQINAALQAAAAANPNGVVTLASFNHNYHGNQNDSYREIVTLIGAGYVNFQLSAIPLRGANFAGILTR